MNNAGQSSWNGIAPVGVCLELPGNGISHMSYEQTTDDALRALFPPRRSCCGPRLGDAKDDAAWADTLDWQTNDYDLHRLIQRLCDRLDWHYRQQFGVRLDQLADRLELTATARRAASWYSQAEQRYRTVGIHAYLYRQLDRLVSRRARRV